MKFYWGSMVVGIAVTGGGIACLQQNRATQTSYPANSSDTTPSRSAAESPTQAVSQATVASSVAPPRLTDPWCKTEVSPEPRQGKSLFVDHSKHAFRNRNEQHVSKGRNHTGYRGSDTQTWVGMIIPNFVPLVDDERILTVLDPVADGVMAFYAEKAANPACNRTSTQRATQCGFSVSLFKCNGEKQWHVRLNDLIENRHPVEVQDVYYYAGALYLNEACIQPADPLKDKCSSLVAIDPVQNKVLWRTIPMVSNGVFYVESNTILASFSTAKIDRASQDRPLSYVTLVRRQDGVVIERVKVLSSYYSETWESPSVIFQDLINKREIKYTPHPPTGAKHLKQTVGPTPVSEPQWVHFRVFDPFDLMPTN